MMIHQLTIENYRGFQHYELDGLQRVNLLVGKNNSGKTSVLEALELLHSGCDPTAMIRIAQRRDEVTVVEEDQSRLSRPSVFPQLSHQFFRRDLTNTIHISTTTEPVRYLAAKVCSSGPERFQKTLFPVPERLIDEQSLQIELHDHVGRVSRVWITDDGVVDNDAVRSGYRPIRRTQPSELKRSSTVFVSADSVDVRQMFEMWDQVTSQSREEEVYAALRVLSPNVRDVVFKVSHRPDLMGKGGILVGFRDQSTRIPLGSMGDGMRRILGLAIALVYASDGLLLVDEIDTGLHHSVLPTMWEFLTQACERTNTMLVATTHSEDCIRGLRDAVQEGSESLQKQVALFSLDRRLSRAVLVPGDELDVVVDHKIEVRG